MSEKTRYGCERKIREDAMKPASYVGRNAKRNRGIHGRERKRKTGRTGDMEGRR